MWRRNTLNIMLGVQRKWCLKYQKANGVEKYISDGDGKSVEVEAVRHFRLLLFIGFYLNLKDNFVVPLFRRNLILVSYRI
jgi:hypothetical protein